MVGPDAQRTGMELTSTNTEEERELPSWVVDPEQAEQVWGAYNSYLRGTKVHVIAQSYDTTPTTVYRWIGKARAELPYHVMGRVEELVGMRMEWIQRALRLGTEIESSQLRLDRKVEQISKLMNATGAWMTAVEELTGARRGTGTRININTDGAAQTAIMFDMDKVLQMQKPRDPD